MKNKRKRVAYLVSHPIQYQAPLLRKLANDFEIELTVFFCSDISVKEYFDAEFGVNVKWDVPLLEGYHHVFLPAYGRKDEISFWKPLNYGLITEFRRGQFDVLWIHGYSRLFNFAAILAAKLMGIKVLLRDEANLISARRSFVKRAIKRMLFLGLNSLCDGFLAIGTLNQNYYLSQGIPREKIFMVPYAVDNILFQDYFRHVPSSRDKLRAELGLEAGRPIILYASKMIARKRPIDLLEAYISMSPDGVAEPHPYLIFVGDGEMRRGLEYRTADLNWNSIRFVGFKNQTELPHYFDLCDVFVLPSVSEPWGLVVNEVMNAARAVVVSDQVGCNPDLVINGSNGYVFKSRDINDLRRALSDVLQTPERSRELGGNSLIIINRWSFDDDVDGLREALSFVCRKGDKVF